MKTSLILLLQTIMITFINAQTIITSNGDQQLWGVVTTEDLMQEPFQEWYKSNQEDHASTLTQEDGKHLKDVQVKVFLGTWCGDTKFLVPKFIKVWNQMGLDESQLQIIALHVDSIMYKQGPDQETIGYNIHKVPTFVFEKDGKEIGRIVERTVFDLDTDIRLISTEKPYKNRYQAVSLMDKFLNTTHADSLILESTLKEANRLVRREVSKSSELNVYAYILKYQGEIERAKFVYQLNKQLFPFHPSTHMGYGKLLMELGELEAAEESFYEALRIKKEDPYIIKKLAEIAEKSKENKT